MPGAYKTPITKGLAGAYKDLQDYIKEREGVSEELGAFILNYDEIRYYRDNHYYEVNWGVRALILDIEPEYYCELLGKTNRQIIADEKAPVVAKMCEGSEFTDPEELPRWDIHHIGQKNRSPFALIPHQIHCVDKNSVFHFKGIQSSEIDRDAFETQKIAFWKRYIKEYDKALGFKGIKKDSLYTAYVKKNEKRLNDATAE